MGERLLDPAKIRFDPDVVIGTISQIVGEQRAEIIGIIEQQCETFDDRLADLRRSLKLEMRETALEMEAARDSLSRENELLRRDIVALRAELDGLRKAVSVIQRWSK